MEVMSTYCHTLPNHSFYKPHDYVVYVQWGHESGKKAEKPGPDFHAGETETSRVMVTRPNLVHMDRAASESGAEQKRVKLPESVFTGIGWYARFPNHYSGDGTLATQELGQADVDRDRSASHPCDQGRRREPEAAKGV